MRIAEKVMHQKFQALVGKCEQKCDRSEKKMRRNRERKRVHRLGNRPVDDDDDLGNTMYSQQRQAIMTHYINKQKKQFV